MQYLGKGKALRPESGGSGLFGPALTSPPLTFSAAEEVYLAPGMPGGFSDSELRNQSSPVQFLVMSAWFRANFRQAFDRSADVESGPALTLANEFDSLVAEQSIATLTEALLDEAPVWVERGVEAPDAAEGANTLCARLDEVEEALAKLQPARGGIGHNNPPDGPLTGEEHAEASKAITELREQSSSTRPDSSRTQRAAQSLAKVSEVVGRWIWKRVEIAIDEVIKKGVGTASVLGIVYAMDAWQNLTGLLEAVGRWISQLPG